MLEVADPRFPIGPFQAPAQVTPEDRSSAVETLAQLPALLREAVRDLSNTQLNTHYRTGGWTIRQVVHHVADSHMTALFRVKKALTEEWPAVPGYGEAQFADLADASAPIEASLNVIEGVHARWVMLLQALDEEQWRRGYMHAERGRQVLDIVILNYAWHSRHHLAHVTNLRLAKGW